MKAAIWYDPKDIRIENIPAPSSPAEDEIQVRIAYTGICGTDLKEYTSGPTFIPWDTSHPLTGHFGPHYIGA